MRTWTLWSVCLSFLVCSLPCLHSSTQTVPIGVILDQEEDEVRRAIGHIVEYNNNNDSRTRVSWDVTIDMVDLQDSFQLTSAICRQLDKGVFLLFGSSSSSSFNTIQSFSQALHVPYVLYTPNRAWTARKASRFVISLSPTYIEPIIDLVRFFGWDRIYFLYDSDDGLWELQSVYDSFPSHSAPLAVDARRLRDTREAHDLLRNLDRLDVQHEKRIVLSLSSHRAVQAVLNQIVDVGMNRENYHYLIGGAGIHLLDLRSFLHGGVNITGFRLIKTRQGSWSGRAYLSGRGRRRKGRRKPLLSNPSTDAALAVDGMRSVTSAVNAMLADPEQRYIFKTFRHGLLYNNGSQGVQCRSSPVVTWQHGPSILETVKKTTVRGFTGRLTFNKYGFRRGYRLDLMHLQYKQPLRKVGYWSESTGLNTNLTSPQPRRKELAPNRTRIVTTIIQNPFTMVRGPAVDGAPRTGNDRFEGFCVDLAELLAESVGFDYVIVLVKDGTYGTKDAEGSWTGMIGELVRQEADIAIAPLSISEERERVVDFSKPFMNTGISIMIKKPEKQKPGMFSFMSPLSDSVWLCITVGFLTVSLILFFVGRFSPLELEAAKENPALRFTFTNTLWFSLGALMQQGSDVSPRSISGRIVGSAWWFFTLIIISSYTANLAAFLTIERLLTPIGSADDLAAQTEIRYGFMNSGSTLAFFKNTQVTVYKKMWNFMKDAYPSVFTRTVDEGVERVRNSKSKYAFLLESAMNEYHNQRRPCNTMMVGRNLDSKGYGVATTMGSDIRHAINIDILELREVGMLHKLEQRWWYDKGECGSDSNDASQSALTLSNVSGIFHILIGGLTLAMLVAFLNYIFHLKFKRRKREKKEERGAALLTVEGRQSGERGRSRARLGENGSLAVPSEGRLISFEDPADICPVD